MNALSLKNLCKTYSNGFEALRGIDLTVSEGDFFALLGPNGAGKSTAIGIITSLVNKTAGGVEVFGHDLDRDPEAVKSCIGLVPQEFNFNQWEPVGEIVVNQAGYYGIPRSEAWRRAEESLRQLDLWEKRTEMAMKLSGGMKRRLMIARALVHKPKLLILDEPTAGVDIEIRRSMWRFLRKINYQGTTIILTTHYLEEAESLCRHVAIIDEGRIIVNDPMSQVLRKLSVETLVFNLAEAVDGVAAIDGYAVRMIDPTTLEADVTSDRGVNDLFAALSSRGIRVVSMRNKANRLEELFMRLVDSKEERGEHTIVAGR